MVAGQPGDPTAERPNGHRLTIAAEAAQGYQADWAKELALVDLAAAAGADAIKFQLLHDGELLTADHPLCGHVRDLELPPERWQAVADRARSKGIALFVDVFGRRGLELAADIGAAAVKVHASDMLNERLLSEIADSPVSRVLLSAGGSEAGEIGQAAALLPGKELTLILGFQAYPTAIEDNGLRRLAALAELLPEAELGFADHTAQEEALALWLPALALAFGVTYVEKHLTIAQVLQDPDYQSALDPDRFAGFAANLRAAEAALGVEGAAADEMSDAERAYRLGMKRHVVAAEDLQGGTQLGRENLVLMRAPEPPADALLRLEDAVGAVLDVDVPKGAPLGRGQLR
jgi:N,N'-diacetyllegionaminate synthase